MLCRLSSAVIRMAFLLTANVLLVKIALSDWVVAVVNPQFSTP